MNWVVFNFFLSELERPNASTGIYSKEVKVLQQTRQRKKQKLKQNRKKKKTAGKPELRVRVVFNYPWIILCDVM